MEKGGGKKSLDNIVILIPVYNDWESFSRLAGEINRALQGQSRDFHILAVNDGSTQDPDNSSILEKSLTNITSVSIMHLACNLGHQKAIATGLSEIVRNHDPEAVIIMDSDGEDKPEYLPALLDSFKKYPNHITAAARKYRSENMVFRFFYQLYKLLFFLLTGKHISFGNFCLLPIEVVGRVVHMAGLWTNLPATLIRTGLPISMVPTRRGTRYGGRSSMDFASLVIHGFSSMAVLGDYLFVRMLLFSMALMGTAVAGLLAALFLNCFIDPGIFGSTATGVGLMAVLFIQAAILLMMALLLLFFNRTGNPVIPFKFAKNYIRKTEKLF